ncbi:MAG: hypothetical protein ACLPV8_02415 [Steroidobacteraceae bacterium]
MIATPDAMVTLLELLEAHAGGYWMMAGNLGQLIVKMEMAQTVGGALHDSHIAILGNTISDMIVEARAFGV